MNKLSRDNVVSFPVRAGEGAWPRYCVPVTLQVRRPRSLLRCIWQRDVDTGRLRCLWVDLADEPVRLRRCA
jgi:hypothetical protein